MMTTRRERLERRRNRFREHLRKEEEEQKQQKRQQTRRGIVHRKADDTNVTGFNDDVLTAKGEVSSLRCNGNFSAPGQDPYLGKGTLLPRYPSSPLRLRQQSRLSPFLEVFAPLAHHLFPEGWTRSGVEIPSHFTTCFPARTDRIPVSPQCAMDAIRDLRRMTSWSSSINRSREGKRKGVASFRGLFPGEMWAVAVAACATLPRRRGGEGVGTRGDYDDDSWAGGSATTFDCCDYRDGKGGGVADGEGYGDGARPIVWVGEGSRLVDGSARWFVELVRCMIPSERMETVSALPDEHCDGVEGTHYDNVLLCEAVSMLLSECSAERCDSRGKCSVLRFLTLAVRSGYFQSRGGEEKSHSKCCVRRRLSRSVKQTLSSLYAVPFSMLSEPQTAPDAVRLLHAITRKRHVRAYRARKVRKIYDDGMRCGSAAQTSASVAPLLLLLQLYARYDPVGCGRFLPGGMVGESRLVGGAYSRHFRFPDAAWQRDFFRGFFGGNGGRDGDTGKNSTGLAIGKLCGEESSSQALQFSIGPLDFSLPSSLSRTLELLGNKFDGVRSSSMLASFHMRTLRASDLLRDDALRHLILLSWNAEGREAAALSKAVAGGDCPFGGCDVPIAEVRRLSACLPHMLYEEWYEPDDEDDADADCDSTDGVCNGAGQRFSFIPATTTKVTSTTSSLRRRLRRNHRRVLDALTYFVRRADSLPPEAENFILEEILPNWDGGIGDSDGTVFDILCRELVGGAVSPPPPSDMTFVNVEQRVLRKLGRLYVFASPREKHSIVSGALASLVRRWGRLPWTATTEPPEQCFENTARAAALRDDECGTTVVDYHIDTRKIRVMRELVEWTDNMILTGLIAEDNGADGGHELVRLSALDFFESALAFSKRAVGLCASSCCGPRAVFLPSPALVYRLLLSNTAICIDRTCCLLVKYGRVLESLEEERSGKKRRRTKVASLPVMHGKMCSIKKDDLDEKVSLFNCYIRDFCAVLWHCSPIPSPPALLLPNAGDCSLQKQQCRDGEDHTSWLNSILFTDLSDSTLTELHLQRETSTKRRAAIEDDESKELGGENDNDQSCWTVSTALSITHGAPFAGFASEFLVEERLQQQQMREYDISTDRVLSPDMFWEETGKLKSRYLDYLRDMGFFGLYDFLVRYVSSLAGKKDRETHQEKR